MDPKIIIKDISNILYMIECELINNCFSLNVNNVLVLIADIRSKLVGLDNKLTVYMEDENRKKENRERRREYMRNYQRKYRKKKEG
jgi:hypothetical protein